MMLAIRQAQMMGTGKCGCLTVALKLCSGLGKSAGSVYFMNPNICPSSNFHQRHFGTGGPTKVLQHNTVNHWQPESMFLHSKPPSLQCCRFKSSSPPHIIHKVTEDVDIDKVREDVRKEKLMGKKVEERAFFNRIQETLAQKCDEAIKNLNPEDQKRLKVIQLEHSFLFSEGYAIESAEDMTSENWLEALNLPSTKQRLKYYLYISKKRHFKEADRQRRQERKEENLDREKPNPYEHGRIFMRIYERTMRRWLDYRLSAVMRFGTPLVLDMDYAKHMRPQELRNTGKQVHSLYCQNRDDEEFPFHLHLTGCANDNPIFRTMQLNMQGNDHLMATVTEKSYLDLFDKDKLVYLSPNGREVMKNFDHSAIYIIGIFNDKATQKPLSYARAKEQGIRCQRFPLDEYLDWTSGSKALTLDQVQEILIALKNGASWHEAFKVVPKRKIRRSDDSE